VKGRGTARRHRVHFRPFFEQEHQDVGAALICGHKKRRPAGVIEQLEVGGAARKVGGNALGVVVDGQLMNTPVLAVMVEKAAPGRNKGATRGEQQDPRATFKVSFHGRDWSGGAF
jgi:hypothetical protein